MALHPDFPRSPYAPLVPSQRWFPADEALRTTAYDKLLPPLVAKIREQVHAWRQKGYAGASATSVSLLRWWFETEHLARERRRFAVAVPLLLRPARGRRDADLAVRRPPRPRQVRPASLRRFRRGVLRHVRRGLAALRAEDGHRRRQDEGPLAADRVELLSPALRAGLDALAQLPRHRAQHHRPRSPAGGLRRPADLLQRSGPARTTATTAATGATTSRSRCTSRTTSGPSARPATSS